MANENSSFLELLGWFVGSIANVIISGVYYVILPKIFCILFWAILCIYFCGMTSKKKANIICGISSGGVIIILITQLVPMISYIISKQLYISQKVFCIKSISLYILDVAPTIFVFIFFLLCIKDNQVKKVEN